MARQEVDIGVEGNDGTGDSVRESFRKVNENFREIYAVVGKGGQISFTSLSDTPDTLDEFEGGGVKAFIPVVKQDATGIRISELASDSAFGEGAVDTIQFDVSVDGKLILSIANVRLITDPAPTLGGPLNAAGQVIANVDTANISAFNNVHGTALSVDDIVIDKKFADKSYIPRQLPGETINVPEEPADQVDYEFSFSVLTGDNRANVTAHGLTRGSDGAPYIFKTTGAGLNWSRTVFDEAEQQFVSQSSLDTDEDGNLIYNKVQNGDTVYIGVIDVNNIGLWFNAADALDSDVANRERLRLKLSLIDSQELKLQDANYDETLEGFFLRKQVMPRESVVRRQGDKMEGALILHDHPGDLAGAGSPNGDDDLQAVSKLYVDSQSQESSANLFVSTVGDDDQLIAPPGKEGASLAYAYRTLGAAARKAEAIQIASSYEPGPYMQDIISSRTIDPNSPPVIEKSRVQTGGISVGGNVNRQNTKTIIDANIDFIIAEVIAWAQTQITNKVTTNLADIVVDWTGRVFDVKLAEDELLKSINASTLDYLSGNSVNFLSNRAAIEYYQDEYGRSQAGLIKEVFATLLERTRSLVGSIIIQSQVDPVYQSIYDQQYISFGADVPDLDDLAFVAGDSGTLQLQRNIIKNGVFSASDVPTTGTRFVMFFSNTVNGVSESGFVDQGNPQNRDLRVGKIIRGKTSGALGRIISYYTGADAVNNPGSDDDRVELELLKPIEFIVGENLEYGNIVNERNITIKIETGTYYEDYPIKVPPNVSLVGDEFRRVIIRPRRRTSQSPWASTYFYRDQEFDGLTGNPNTSVTGIADTNLPTSGEAYTNPLTGEVDGYFGRHYLVKPGAPKNVDRLGTLAFDNPGSYVNAATLIEKNREFIQEEIIAFIEYRIAANFAGFINVFNPSFNDQAKDRYRNYVGAWVDAITKDLREGENLNVLEAQANIFFELQEYPDEDQVLAGSLINMLQMMQDMVNNLVWVDNFVQPYRGAGHPVQYINTNLVVEDGIDADSEILDKQVSLLDFAIEPAVTTDETNYNCAKLSTDLDVFLMNDATILRNMTVQGHGGFMCVLDPEGQILTKSPYIQTGSSFSQTLNRQAFRGGMLVDAFCANTPMKVTSKINNFRLRVEAEKNSGLYIRKPQTPAPFYIDGIRYQVNDIIEYDRGGINGPATATLVLDARSGKINPDNVTEFLGFEPDPTNIVLYPDGYDITLQTAGNRSQLGNDFTQVNDLGYGLVTINGGLSEMVSMFTYYCHTAYYAGNGGQIRSVAGSNANGVYGLVSEGSDPNEVPDDVVSTNDMVQGAVTFSAQVVLTLTTEQTVAVDDIITCSNNTGSGTVIFPTVGNQIFLKDVTGTYAVGEEIIINGTPAAGVDIAILDTTSYENKEESLAIHLYEIEHIPTNKGEIEYYHFDGATPLDRIARYELANIEVVDEITVDGYRIDCADLGPSGSPTAFGEYDPANRTIDETDPVTAVTEAQIIITKVRAEGGKYNVAIFNNEKGEHYKVGDTFTIKGSKLGGTDGAAPNHDATVTVTRINQSRENFDLGINTGSIRSLSISGDINIIPGYTPLRNGQVYKANFSTSNDTFDNDGLLADIPTGQYLTIRQNNTHTFSEIESTGDLTIRPSTAINFQEDFAYTYRSISFGSNDSAGGELDIDQSLVGFDSGYDYIRLNVARERIDLTPADFDGAQISIPINGTTLGNTTGDVSIAINKLTEIRDIWRINNNFLTDANYRPSGLTDGSRNYDFTGELPKVIVWNGKKHYVYNYREFVFNDTTNLYNDQRKVYNENHLFAVVDLKEIEEVKLTFDLVDVNGEDVPLRTTFPRIVSYLGGISEARIRQVGNQTAWGVVKIAGNRADEIKLYEWSGVNFNTTGALEVWEGDPADPDPATGSWTAMVDQNGDPVIPSAQIIRESNITNQATGIVRPLTQGFSGTITLRAGLQDGSPATITIDISTCRATGHDFLDIGTGSFNQSNYPNVILGFPSTQPLQENEIQERNKGRVFYVSTDQDGFFRVGRFFTVDQGTGTVTFAASIALSDVDGIGFKRGVVVTEFSTDSAMSDNADDTVPTESAVRGYVSRRLGYDQAGNSVPNPLGPSVITQNGAVPMLGNLKMNGNTIENIAPVDINSTPGTTAVNRDYVDLQTQEYAVATSLRDVENEGATTNEFLGFTNTKTIYISSETSELGVNATFGIGKYLTDVTGSQNFGKIVGNYSKLDISIGNVIVVSFEAGPDSYNVVTPDENPTPIYDGDGTFDVDGNLTGITTSGTRNGLVITGPFAEMINISEEPFVDDGQGGTQPVSDISLTTRRLENDDQAGTPTILDTPTAYFDMQINPEVIVNADVNIAADIEQSKLYLQEADNFVTVQTDIPTESIADIVQGYTYQIVSLGDTTQTQWNNAAGTTGDTYVANQTFVAVLTGVGATTTGTVKRVISTSTLPKGTVTRQNNQAELGLSTFDFANFRVTRGYVQLKNNGITLDKIKKIGSDTVLGNSAASSANVAEVTFDTVVDEGNGLQHDNFNTVDINGDLASPADYATAGIMERTGNDSYRVAPFTTAGAKNSVVKTDTNSGITADSYKIGTGSSPTVLTTTTADGLKLSNIQGGLILSAAGDMTADGFGPDVKIPGNVNIGKMGDPNEISASSLTASTMYEILSLGDDVGQTPTNWNNCVAAADQRSANGDWKVGDTFIANNTGNGDGTVQVANNFTRSTLQEASEIAATSPFIAADWMYTSFIETPREKGLASTGIALGNGAAGGGEGQIGFVVGDSSNNTVKIPFTFDSTGTFPDLDSTYDIGTDDNRYKTLYVDDIEITNGFQVGSATEITDNAGNIDTLYYIASKGSTDWGAKTGNNPTTAAAASGDLIRITNTGNNGSGTLDSYKIILNEETGDAWFANDALIGGDVIANNILNRGNDGTNTVGTASKKFQAMYATTFYGTATQAQYADLAENYLGDAEYESGTVLVFGGDAEVTVTNTKGDHRVAGVVTTNPAYLMNSHLEGDHVTGIALQGRVPCKVIGKVSKGDMLVTSAIPGYAMVDNNPSIGRVIGKAVGTKDDDGKGIVEVVVGRV